MASTSGLGGSRGLFGLACLCVLGLAVFLGSGPASAADTICPNAAIREQQGSSFLTDCRAYEMVSPVEKSGNQAGVDGLGNATYSRAGASGNAISYFTSGPMGEAFRGLQFFTTGTRTATGWTAKASIPGPEAGISLSFFNQSPNGLLVSDDASRVAFTSGDTYVTENPPNPEDNAAASISAYVTSPAGPIQWLTRPLSAAAEPRPGDLDFHIQTVLAGGSQDLSTIYFGYCGTITDADAPRTGRLNYGFYVSEDGQVSTAGVLPDGTVDPDGAIPAAGVTANACNTSSAAADPTTFGNPVSEDGALAPFVSPDPYAGSSRPSQLYVHRRGMPSVLASRSELTGLPAATGIQVLGRSFAPASRSGAFLVFASADRLTADAPNTGVRKLYRFEVETGELTYLDGVNPSNDVLGVSDDGRRILLQVFPEGEPSGLVLWQDGEVIPVGDFSAGNGGATLHVHLSTDGSTFVFNSPAPFIGGGTTQTPGVDEVYRYVAGQPGPPTCLSCPPPGQSSTTPAHFSSWVTGSQPVGGVTLADSRNMSPDGRHVFFDTRAALVPTDTNGRRDVYEWSEGGTLALISTGRSDRDTFILDTSASTDDVFFISAEGIDPADTDESYDVYDARVGGGFARASVTSCSGEECQAPPSAAPSPTPALSGLLHGPGNAKQRVHAKKKHAKKKRHSKGHAKKKRHPSASSSTTVAPTVSTK